MRTMVTMLSALTVLAMAVAGVALWRVERAEASREVQPAVARQQATPHIVEAPLPVANDRAPAPAPRRAEPIPAPAREGELRVRRLVLATGVEAREPVGAAETFARADVDRLYAFVELANRSGVPQQVVVTFEPEGQARDGVGHVELEVGSGARWRTWAYTRMLRAGSWDAVVRDSEGHELARTAFSVTD